MNLVGYSLVNSSNTEVAFWGNSIGQFLTLPNVVTLPSGITVHAPGANQLLPGGYKIIERWIEGDSTKISLKVSESITHNISGKTIVTWEYRNPNNVELKEYVSNKRREIANSAVIVSVDANTSIPVWMDTDSRNSMTGLVVASGIIPNLTTNWKGADGVFYPLDANGIIALSLGTMSVIQTLFQKEEELFISIEANTVNSFVQIDQSTWPARYGAL